jgi:peroxiredoxin
VPLALFSAAVGLLIYQLHSFLDMTTVNVPALPLRNLKFIKGDLISLEQIKGNNILLLESFATWCPPCKQSIPHLSKVYEKYKSRGLELLGVSNEAESVLRPFVQSMGDQMSYRVASGDLSEYSRLFNVQGIPHAFLIDHNLTVRWSGHPMEPSMEGKIDVLLNELKQFNAKQSEAADMQVVGMKQLTSDHLTNYSISDLMSIMKSNHLDSSQCLEKSDLVKALLESNKQQSTKIKATSAANTTSTASRPSSHQLQESKEPATQSSTSSANTQYCSGDSCSIPPHSGSASEVASSGIDLATVTEDELNQLPISTLKKLMKEQNIELGRGAFERSDLVKELLRQQLQTQSGTKS